MITSVAFTMAVMTYWQTKLEFLRRFNYSIARITQSTSYMKLIDTAPLKAGITSRGKWRNRTEADASFASVTRGAPGSILAYPALLAPWSSILFFVSLFSFFSSNPR